MDIKNIIQKIKNNSLDSLNSNTRSSKPDTKLSEAIESIDVEKYEQIISKLIEDKMKTSLAYKICEIQPMSGPVGVIFSSKFNDGLKISKTKVEAETKKIKTEITQEAIEDIHNLTGDDNLLVNFLRKASDKEENTSFIDFLSNNAQTATDVTIPPEHKPNSEMQLFYILNKVGEIAATINKDSYRTYKIFCILPFKNASGPLSMSYTTSEEDTDLSLGTYRKIQFFINPVTSDDNIYVGLIDQDDSGSSSVIFSPYQYFLALAEDPESGKLTINVYNRYNFSLNPLDNKMVYKFKIK